MSGPQWSAVFGQVGQKPAAPAAADPGVQARKRLAIEDGTTDKKVDLALKLGVINSQRNRLLEAACTTQFTIKNADPIYQAMKSSRLPWACSLFRWCMQMQDLQLLLTCLDIGYMGLDDDIADKIEWEPTIQWG